jgi:hypothetical protein
LEQKKKRFKLNIIDVIILALILVAAGFFVHRYAIRPNSPADPSRQTFPFVMILDSIELPNDRFEGGKIAVGDTLIDKISNVSIGKITHIETRPSRSYTVTSDGDIRLTSRPEFSHLIITVEGRGYRPREGGLIVDALHIFNNKDHEINIRDSSFFLRIINFSIEDGQ